MSLLSRFGFGGNARASACSAFRNSGLPAAPPSLVRRPPSSTATAPIDSTSSTPQAPIVRHGWRLAALASRSVTPRSLRRSMKLFVERHERELERPNRVVVRGDVVAVLEHWQQVKSQR